MRTGYQERIICSDSSSVGYQAILDLFTTTKVERKYLLDVLLLSFFKYRFGTQVPVRIQATRCMKRGS